MLLKDYCYNLVRRYEAQGCKQVRVDRATTIKIGKNFTSFMLFGESAVSMEAEVNPEKYTGPGEVSGVSIRITYIKPRCRKESHDYIDAQLIEKPEQQAV